MRVPSADVTLPLEQAAVTMTILHSLSLKVLSTVRDPMPYGSGDSTRGSASVRVGLPEGSPAWSSPGPGQPISDTHSGWPPCRAEHFFIARYPQQERAARTQQVRHSDARSGVAIVGNLCATATKPWLRRPRPRPRERRLRPCPRP